jgi:hypothetical protein
VRSLRAGLALAVLLLAPLPGLARAVTVAGTVVDGAGKPVEYATVSVPALRRGAATDEQGRFTLDLPAGRHQLEVSQLGYEKTRVTVTVADAPLDTRVVLRDEPIPLAEVAVSASAFGKTGKSEGATLRRIQVFTTPGGASDIFQSLRTLPGINAPNEGAAVYTRGGPPDETSIRLDGGEMGHPYHYEGASGGLFSSLDTYMLRSAYFSSGGFSAKYGGVLSGVLDIETQDPLNLHTFSVGANLAGGGASASWALVPDRLSFIGSARWSDPRLLFRLYGSSRHYELPPRGSDDAAKLLWRYSRTGRLALLYLDSRDRSALDVHVLGFLPRWQSRSTNQLASLQFSDAIGGTLALRGQVSGQYWQNDWMLGGFGGGQSERNAQANLDAVWAAGHRHEVSFGFNLRRQHAEIDGHSAADSTDYSADAPTRHYSTRSSEDEPGVYLEDKLRVAGPVYATLGARVDYTSSADTWRLDPRAALAWRVDERQTVRLASGRYHQSPGARYRDPVYGNPTLAPMEADHLIAGYEWKSDHSNLRAEAFRKNYRDLVTNDAATFYSNDGFGFAQGLDLYLQGNVKWLSGWISYGYLDTQRKEFSNPRLLPSPYGVRHSLTLVSSYQYNSTWMLGARYSTASGRPYTPVEDAVYDAGSGLWRPVFAEDNSGRMPVYNRLDVRLTRLFSIPKGLALPASNVCVAYCEGINVLGIRNVLEYYYSADYSQRYPQDSYFSRRMLVVGFGLSW